jgi:hypothetical protein
MGLAGVPAVQPRLQYGRRTSLSASDSPGQCAPGLLICSITLSRLKLAAFMRGG